MRTGLLAWGPNPTGTTYMPSYLGMQAKVSSRISLVPFSIATTITTSPSFLHHA